MIDIDETIATYLFSLVFQASVNI